MISLIGFFVLGLLVGWMMNILVEDIVDDVERVATWTLLFSCFMAFLHVFIGLSGT